MLKVGGVDNDRSASITEPYIIQRGLLPDGKPRLLAFIGQPVWSLDDFHKRCPRPEIPASCVRYKGNGKKEANPDAQEFKDLLAEYDRKNWGYMILKTLEPSNLEFEKISLDDPKTWGGVEEALREELGYYEFARVMQLIDEANNIDAAKLEENRLTFFRQSTPANTDDSPPDGPSNTSE